MIVSCAYMGVQKRILPHICIQILTRRIDIHASKNMQNVRGVPHSMMMDGEKGSAKYKYNHKIYIYLKGGEERKNNVF